MMSSAAAANAVMMGAGYFTPLTGYMNRADALSVAEHARHRRPFLASRWSIWQRVARSGGQRLALTDPNRGPPYWP